MAITGEYVPSPEEWVRTQVDTYESSNGAEGTTLNGKPVVVVSSIGRKSGKLRKSPLMRVEHDGAYALIASMGGAPKNPVWYWNIVDHPEVEIRDEQAVGTYVARELHDDERELWWKRAVEVWPPYAEYATKTDRLIPVLLAEPVAASD
ncbi:nitroreductase family deazaflavin-dependent oxidoreductase [Millisia brevis]|uniref:nitroreductase family deazaflavin-dependent oxidoreductase n=1 Tax=Millisia brevis TaxID=264148 RepID=UPI00082AC372|nr:nitroreductase family deazaflavin-dependent oxidoreductase [Millisia brevis]